MDIFDQATELERLHLDFALAAHNAGRTAQGRGPLWVDGKPCCRECGEEIPAKRLAAIPGCELCVECAESA
jgi:phage/conjugal plasmid C-4 type zinc finger TraR family protein